jgi:hypothetical protein
MTYGTAMASNYIGAAMTYTFGVPMYVEEITFPFLFF